jgi:hypothetical protein
MKWAWLLISIFAARFFVTAIAYPEVDGDLAWQRWLGAQILRDRALPHSLGNETFSAMGAPWIPHEWLFSIFAALGRSGLAWDVFAAGVAGCAVAALALAAWRAERAGASTRAIAICTTLAGFALFESFGVRAQVVAWPLVLGFLVLLESDGPLAWWAVAVAALWSNVHGSAALAPALAFVVAAGAALDARAITPRVKRLGLIGVASLGAICLNPFGAQLPAYALMLVRSPITHFILEWKATGLEDTSFLYGALPLLGIVLLFGVSRKQPHRWENLLLFGLFFWLMLGAARNIAIFALIALPLAATALTQRFAWLGHDPAPEPGLRPKVGPFALAGGALVTAVVVAALLLRQQDPNDDSLGTHAIAALERSPGTHRVLCSNFAWCGLLVGSAHERVFLDGRADPYPPRVWDDYVAIAKLQPGWRERLDAYGVDAVLAGRDAPLDQALSAYGGWRAAYGDKQYRLWIRGAVHPHETIRNS